MQRQQVEEGFTKPFNAFCEELDDKYADLHNQLAEVIDQLYQASPPAPPATGVIKKLLIAQARISEFQQGVDDEADGFNKEIIDLIGIAARINKLDPEKIQKLFGSFKKIQEAAYQRRKSGVDGIIKMVKNDVINEIKNKFPMCEVKPTTSKVALTAADAREFFTAFANITQESIDSFLKKNTDELDTNLRLFFQTFSDNTVRARQLQSDILVYAVTFQMKIKSNEPAALKLSDCISKFEKFLTEFASINPVVRDNLQAMLENTNNRTLSFSSSKTALLQSFLEDMLKNNVKSENKLMLG